MLCELCQSINYERLPSVPEHFSSYSRPHDGSGKLVVLSARMTLAKAHKAGVEDVGAFSQPLGLPFHQSIDELKSAAEHCSICFITHRGVSRSLAALFDAEKDETYMYYRQKTGGKPPDGRLWLAKRKDGGHGFIVLSAGNEVEAWLLAAVGFCVDDGSPLEALITGRIIQEESSSAQSIARAIAWVKECDEHHPSSRCSYGNEKLPARVLDLARDSSPETISLIETNGEVGRYIALSHVWGEHNHYTTTRATINARKTGISLTDLPTTFRDAVTMTRKLGIRYLWIDSICICQDDGPDWERESAKMAQTYTNAYLVIAATGSSSDSDGFFTRRTPPNYSSFNYTWSGISGVVHTFELAKEESAHHRSVRSLDQDPLSKRGWALQERFLARRMLHSASAQFFYECSDSFKSEDGFRGRSRFDNIDTTEDGTHDDPESKENARSTFRGHGNWHLLLHEYYHRNLTKSSDKLPAISGLARTIQERTGDEYVAGLWQSQLIECLLWQAMGAMQGKTKASPQYRAPSWSWASIDGPFGNLGIAWSPVDESARWTDVAEIVNWHVEVKGENPYGEVKSGHIIVKAPLEPLTPSKEKEPDWETVPHKRALRVTTRTGNAFGSYCIFDYIDDDTALSMPLFALILVRKTTINDKTSDRTYQALLVSPVGTEGDYRRVGKIIFGWDNLGVCDWMEDESKFQTIKLI